MLEPTPNETALRVVAEALEAEWHPPSDQTHEVARLVLAALNHPDVRAALIQVYCAQKTAVMPEEFVDAVLAALTGERDA